MLFLNYLYAKFSKPYLFGIDNANTYIYNLMIKERINKIVIVTCLLINIMVIAGIITLL